MRNEPQDDIDDIPSLSARDDDDDDLVPTRGARERTTVYSRETPVVKVKAPTTAPLWALIGALFIAFCGLGWWSFQQISLMEQQLVATQESFARISEDAAGRLQDISGKVTANEAMSREGEALKQRLDLLDAQLQEQEKHRENAQGEQGSLDKRLEQLGGQTTEQRTALAQTQEQLKAVQAELAALKAALPEQIKAAQGEQGKFDAQLKSLAADVAALKKQGNPAADIERLQQDLLVLRSEQENRPAAAPSGTNTAEFDAFRSQVTRNLNALTNQVQTLSQRIGTAQ
ncbi:ATPase [Pseudomonas sp. DTU_2021_1001937_2_SI_NGA_ILE_001]|uniref:ATPase n=1 Tax=Pseudomonas sp. DTU_2021_1001937_2_SI_NGA_ILE_001 TaxID=3077589 RepID=UPI0028FC2B7F|nr:ATPase [Pseudomonas sp. DTU_2021_1001937_2_SI_NGA_ILE_001]WNW11653.1 ATPase [Pseudomonas sp. DTU_2021_1001937_2_SI_NGA_ILE_001]